MHVIGFASERNRTQLEKTLHMLRFEFPSAEKLPRRLVTLPACGLIAVSNDISEAEAEAIALVAQYKSLPLVFCGTLNLHSARLINVITRRANPHIVLGGFEESDPIVRFLQGHPPGRQHKMFVERLSPAFSRLNERVRLPLEAMLESLPGKTMVNELAQRSAYSERELTNILHRAGFRDVHSIFVAVRLINAWAFARDEGYLKIEVAHKAGYESRHGLLSAIRLWTGTKSYEAFARIRESELIDCLVRRVLRQQSGHE